MVSSAVAAVIVWKSTAILVQMTSGPTAGRAPRRGQVCGDNMSEAVRSECRGSFGAIAMRLYTSHEESNGCISIVCHSIPVETRMRHTVPQGLASSHTRGFSHKL